MNGVAAYMLRNDGSFERYLGLRRQMWIGWPTIFTEWFNLERPARFFYHTYRFGDVMLLSRKDPNDATWTALERFITESSQEK